MPYLTRPPCPALRHVVEHIGLQESASFSPDDPHTRILPTGTIDLVFHYGDRFLQFSADGERDEPVAYVTGQRLSPIEVAATGRTGIVVVGLYPWAAPAMLGCNAAVLQGITCDLRHFLPPDSIARLTDQLCRTQMPDARLERVENFLLAYASREYDSLARFAALHLLRAPNLKITGLAREFGISKRQLDRRFDSAIGLTPKQFGRVMRFQQALGALDRGIRPAQVAAETGYYDQAHMNHEFAALAASTPDSLFREREPTPLMASFNRNVSSFYNTLYLN